MLCCAVLHPLRLHSSHVTQHPLTLHSLTDSSCSSDSSGSCLLSLNAAPFPLRFVNSLNSSWPPFIHPLLFWPLNQSINQPTPLSSSLLPPLPLPFRCPFSALPVLRRWGGSNFVSSPLQAVSPPCAGADCLPAPCFLSHQLTHSLTLLTHSTDSLTCLHFTSHHSAAHLYFTSLLMDHVSVLFSLASFFFLPQLILLHCTTTWCLLQLNDTPQ